MLKIGKIKKNQKKILKNNNKLCVIFLHSAEGSLIYYSLKYERSYNIIDMTIILSRQACSMT